MKNALQTRSARRGSDNRGSVFVEFALGFLLFIVLILAVFEGGRLVWTFTTMTHATRQGVRYAIMHGGRNPVADTDIETRVKNNAAGIPNDQLTVTTVWEDTAKAGGSVVRVSASHPINFVASPLVFGRKSMTLNVTARGTVAD